MLTTLERDGTESTVIASRSPGSDSVAVSPVLSINSTSSGLASAWRSRRESTRSASVTSASPRRNGRVGTVFIALDHPGGLERRQQSRGGARVDADSPRELVDSEALLAVAQLARAAPARARPRTQDAVGCPGRGPVMSGCTDFVAQALVAPSATVLRSAPTVVYDATAHVVRPHVPQLRRPGSGRFRVRWRGEHAPARDPVVPRVVRVQLLPSQRGGGAARVVVSPLRLPHVVSGRARHAHERGPESRSSRRARLMSRLTATARRADRPQPEDHVHVRRQEGHRARGRHDRLGAVRRRPADLLPELQVPPPARSDVLLGPLPQLPGGSRRRAGDPRLHRAGPRRCVGRASERQAQPRARRDVGDRHARRPVYASRLLLQDVHPAPPDVARVRVGAAPRGRAWKASEDPGRADLAHGVPAPARRPAGRRRRRRRAVGRARGRQARRRRGARRRRARARRAVAVGGRPRAGAHARQAGPRGRRRDPLQCARARTLRRPRPGVAGLDAAPDPRPPPHLCHRRDRAAARVLRKRPSGRDAVRRCAPAGEPVRRRPRQPAR